MNPQFRIFIDLIHHKLFFGDSIIILEEKQWSDKGVTDSDIEEAIVHLTNHNHLLKYRWIYASDKRTIPTDHKEKVELFKRNELVLRWLYNDQPHTRWLALEISKTFEAAYKNWTVVAQIENGELSYDSMNGSLRKGDAKYDIESSDKRAVFNVLWDNRKIIKNGKTIQKGEAFQKEAVAIQAELIESHKDFSEKKAQFKSIIGGLNRAFKRTKIPLHISQTGGVQIIVSE